MRIPKKQEHIKLKNYLKYIEYHNSKEQHDDMELLKETIKIFYEIDDEKYNEMPYQQILDMYKIIENILQQKYDLIPLFELEGVEYGINPNFEEMTFAELVDCDTNDVLQQMCVLYRPVVKRKGKKYIIEKYKANINYELFKEKLTLDIYTGFVTFFLKIQNDLLNYTLKSLKEEVTDPEKRKILEKSGDGYRGYMNLLGVI